MQNPFLRTQYNYDTNAASDESGLHCEDPTLTVQDGAEETDLNWLMKRYGLLGVLPQGRTAPEYGDFTGVRDYQTAMNAIIEAEKSFMSLPAELRARFNNDPQSLLDFLDNASNREEAVKLGIITAAEPEQPKAAEGSAGVAPA